MNGDSLVRMRSLDMITRAALFAAVAALLFVAYATLSPIEMRPKAAGLQTEHVAAFAVIALLFAVALPRRLVVVAVFLCCIAMGLEAAQELVPGRHARLIDLSFKLLGTGIGLILGWVANNLIRSRFLSRRPAVAKGPTR